MLAAQLPGAAEQTSVVTKATVGASESIAANAPKTAILRYIFNFLDVEHLVNLPVTSWSVNALTIV